MNNITITTVKASLINIGDVVVLPLRNPSPVKSVTTTTGLVNGLGYIVSLESGLVILCSPGWRFNVQAANTGL